MILDLHNEVIKMKNILIFLLITVLASVLFAEDIVSFEDRTVVVMQIGSNKMTVNGVVKEIDPAPALIHGMTFIPARAFMDSIDSTSVDWDKEAGTVNITYRSKVITLALDNQTKYINDRIMLPVRFVAENFGFGVKYDNTTATITITIKESDVLLGLLGMSTVYMTTDISSDGLMAIYKALGANPTGKVAVKISTGEPPNSNYLRPELIKALVQYLNGTIVECNTAYGGSRANTESHLQVAERHGFTAIAPVDIMDADGSISLPVIGGVVLTENFVGANFKNYDYFVVLSHFKGHTAGGLGGAIKNSSIGIASAKGKNWIHSGGTSETGMSGEQNAFLMAMAEANKSVADSLNGNILYINVMNRLSVDCDCFGRPAEPDMHDIGILASFDPVALDKACADLVFAAADGASLTERINSRNGMLTIEHGAKIGLGNLEYRLVKID